MQAFRMAGIAALFALTTVIVGVPMLAQGPAGATPGGPGAVRVDISGDWGVTTNEDQPHRVPSPELGDYTGLPLNDADRQ